MRKEGGSGFGCYFEVAVIREGFDVLREGNKVGPAICFHFPGHRLSGLKLKTNG